MEQSDNKARKIYLIRHAESIHNHNIAELNKSIALNKDVDELEETKRLKFSEETIDCSISKKGEKQTEGAAEIVKDKNISFVITSPLRRCLQTTQRVFREHPNKPKVLVVPLLKEVMSSSCDLAKNIHEVKKEFPEFDFSLFNDFKTPELWFIEVLENESLKARLIKELYETYPNRDEALKNASVLFAAKMREDHSEEYENPIDMNSRVMKAKAWMKEKVKEVPEDEHMAVVAHSRFLRSFVSKEYGQLGEFIGSRRFVNCEVFEYEL